jgi:ComF family protein
MFSRIINLLYPAHCYACGEKIIAWNQNICNACLKKIKRRLPPFCAKCGRQISGEPEAKYVCSDCKNGELYFDRAFSVFYYDGILKKLVHDFKYNKMTALSKEFVESIIDFMKGYQIGIHTEMAVSIPMHPFRLFKREINPSEILAKNIAKKLGLCYSGNILKKTKNTLPQSNLSRIERIKNLKESFSLQKNKEPAIKGKNILLVDDLFTTGSTVNECAKVLKKAGAGYIEVITLARADKSP